MASMQRQPSQPRRSPTATPDNELSERGLIASPPVERPSIPQDSQLIQDKIVDLPAPPRFTSADDDPSVKKCWICFSDSTEDTPETSPWRDPCPCALVAHEQCLLDWIADTEAPKNARATIAAPQIQCPQCKSEIKLARPHSYVVSMYKLFDRGTNRLLLPVGVASLSLDIIYKLTFAHGVHSIYRIFGTEDAARIFEPLLQELRRPPIDFTIGAVDVLKAFIQRLRFRLAHWPVYFGVPAITPILLVSRVNHPWADAILSVLPSVFFALQPGPPGEKFQFGTWPLSASMTFALLPYARTAYKIYYQRIWSERIKQWKKEILPTTSQAQEEAAPEGDPIQRIEDAAEGGNLFEIRVDTGVWEEVEMPDEAAAEVEAEGPEQEDAAPPPVVRDNRPQAPAQPQPQRQVRDEQRFSFSPAELAEKTLGALALPTIAGLAGELLKFALPKSWTATTSVTPRGLLREKWGRSLLGGCLFIVFKDALTIYVRWKMAQMHRNRQVLDYDRSKAKAK